jgi:prenyltransferase beta subunit
MLQVARLAPKLLGTDATGLVVNFLRSKLTPAGGFADRAGNPDLYYTVFGLEGLLALRADLPAAQVAAYLRSFGDGGSLDFVHLSCLARCWACLPVDLRTDVPADAILARVEKFRSADGAYDATPGSATGSLYGCFLALGAYEDLGRAIPDSAAMLRCAESLRTPDGGYANDPGLPLGLTPSTAAAVTLIRHLGQTPPAEVARWLLARCHPQGGFFATPDAPIPDLLSTATALHALVGMHADVGPVKEPCLDFIDSLWTNEGAFHGQWSDDTPDVEYTFYGLLSLGHLSL